MPTGHTAKTPGWLIIGVCILETSTVDSEEGPACDKCYPSFTVLPHWEIWPSAPCSDILLSHIILTLS